MKFFPKTAEGFLTAVLMAQNALLPAYNIVCPSEIFGADPLENAKAAVKSSISLTSFPCAQMMNLQAQYAHDITRHKLTICHTVQYMSTEKEVNDLRCIAADIAENIRKDLPPGADDTDTLRAYQRWLSRFFTYRSTGLTRDHAAAGLLQTRQGVCQSVAALSMVILPHLDIPARYVSGEGYSGTAWGAHAWNAVRVNHAWQHVDFTFGLQRKALSCTLTPNARAHFCRLHRWDEAAQSPALFQNIEKRENALQNAALRLFPAFPYKAELGGVEIFFDTPLFSENRVHLLPLLTVLGGGCEVLNRTLHIVLKGASRSVPLDALPQNGMIPLEALQSAHSPFSVFPSASSVILKIKV